jgi:hypothetical protein
MSNLSSNGLRLILVAVGALVIFLGINIGFGGILTLGWQGQTQFFEVTNEHGYLIQDSHVRFLGGLFGALGIFLIVGATNLRKYQAGLRLAFILVFVGGLARFTMLRPDVVFSADITGSLAAELILMPVLFVWLGRAVK